MAATNVPFQLVGGFPCCCATLFFGLAAAPILYDAFGQYILAQKIRNTPTSKARSAAVGLVELAGKARCEETLVSPITKNKCAYWEVVAQYYYQTKNSSGWRTFFHDLSGKRFYLEDDTGRMLVDPKGATAQIPADFSFQGRLEDRMFFGLLPTKQVDKQVLEYLGENPGAKEAAKRFSGRNLRFMEYYIAEGDPLYVLGSAEPLEGASSAVAHENLIVRKNSTDKLLYLTDSSEKQVLGNIAIKYWVEMVIGTVLALAALVGLVSAVLYTVI